jgi:hypothetical protein
MDTTVRLNPFGALVPPPPTGLGGFCWNIESKSGWLANGFDHHGR